MVVSLVSYAEVRRTETQPADPRAARPCRLRFGSRRYRKRDQQRRRLVCDHCAGSAPARDGHKKECPEQRSRDVLGVLRRVAARVFQFVCEHADEAIVICRLAAKVLLFLFAGRKTACNGLPPRSA